MSQFQINHAENQKYAQLDAPNTGKPAAEVPKELQNARPSSRSSGWKIAGRVALGIVTIGFSELFRLAYKGIRSLCSKSAAAPAQEPRTTGASQSRGLPQASPQADMSNVELAKCVNGKGEMPAEYKAAVDEALGDLRKQFGSSVLPASIPSGKFTSVKALLDSFAKLNPNCARDMFMAVKGAKDPVTPQALKDTLKKHLEPQVKCQALVSEATKLAVKNGGLGGLNMQFVVKNLLTAPGLKNELNNCKSEDDIKKFAQEKLNLGQKMSEYYKAMDATLKELRTIFGDVVPEKLEDALKIDDEKRQTVVSKLDSGFEFGSIPKTREQLAGSFKDYLLPGLQLRIMENNVKAEAEKASLQLSPLTVRSIAKSMLETRGGAIKQAASNEEMKKALSEMNISGAMAMQKNHVTKLTDKYIRGLAEEVQPIMTTFISQQNFTTDKNVKVSEEKVEAFAKHVKNWKNLNGDEKEATAISRQLQNEFQEDLKELKGSSKDPTGYTGNMYNTLVDDSPRASYTIQGEKMTRDKDEAFPAIRGKLEKLLPDPKDQQFISKLINQRSNAYANTFSFSASNEAAQDGTFPIDFGEPIFGEKVPLFMDIKDDERLKYEVTVSEDGKSANVKIIAKQGLVSPGMEKASAKDIFFSGKFQYQFEFELTLSGHSKGQGIQKLTFSQKFMAL